MQFPDTIMFFFLNLVAVSESKIILKVKSRSGIHYAAGQTLKNYMQHLFKQALSALFSNKPLLNSQVGGKVARLLKRSSEHFA